MTTTANIMLNVEQLKALLLRSGTRERCSLLPLVFDIILEVLATAIRGEKRNKKITNCKRNKTGFVCR